LRQAAARGKPPSHLQRACAMVVLRCARFASPGNCAGKDFRMPKESKASTKAKKGKLASLSPERRRRIYLTYRLPEVLGELERLAKETERLTEKLNDAKLPQQSSERAKAEERLVYLREHRPVLMKEVKTLRKQREKLPKGDN